MKELSIEEKTKRYDEALERAKKLQETCDSTTVVGWCEYIFPELKESNGERIKFLIKSCVYASNITPEGREEIFAWLEKQGEQKPAEFDDTNAKRMFIKALERVEEQNNKGYKLTDCDKNSWWEDFKAYTSCIVEQKPWSEEDEARIMAIDLAVNRCLGKWHCCGEKCPISEHNPWLKSLKDRVQHQNTWKPSDEQMDALHYVTNFDYGGHKSTLVSLYEQLKKLKE